MVFATVVQSYEHSNHSLLQLAHMPVAVTKTKSAEVIVPSLFGKTQRSFTPKMRLFVMTGLGWAAVLAKLKRIRLYSLINAKLLQVLWVPILVLRLVEVAASLMLDYLTIRNVDAELHYLKSPKLGLSETATLFAQATGYIHVVEENTWLYITLESLVLSGLVVSLVDQ